MEAAICRYYEEAEKWDEVLEGGEVATGDSLQFIVKTRMSGDLYVLWRDAGGTNQVLFPRIEGEPLSSRQNPVKKGETFVFPDSEFKEDGFTLTPPAGQAALFVFLGKRPLREVEDVLKSGRRIDLSRSEPSTKLVDSRIKPKGLGGVVSTGASTAHLIEIFKLENMSDRDVEVWVLKVEQTLPEI